jgi:hypothetical protein
MSHLHDLTGQRFRRLTVIGRAANDRRGRARWVCACECGGEVSVLGGNLLSGNTTSCGCRRREVAAREYSRKLLRAA